MALFSKNYLLTGEVRSNGGSGVSTQTSATGGGAGGTVLLRAVGLVLGNQLVKAAGGLKGPNYGYQNWQAADGAVGRVAIYYGQSLSGNTLPAAYVQQLP